MHLPAFDGNVPGPPGRDGPGIAGDNGVFGQAFAELVGDDLWLHRFVVARRPLKHQVVPLLHPGLGLFQKAAVGFPFEERKQLGERPPAVSDQADVDRKTKANADGIDIELNATGLSRLGQKFDVGE